MFHIFKKYTAIELPWQIMAVKYSNENATGVLKMLKHWHYQALNCQEEDMLLLNIGVEIRLSLPPIPS
jgi:hypothetical protein